MLNFTQELNALLGTITAQDVVLHDNELNVFDFDTAAISLVEDRLTKVGHTVSVMESRYHFLPSGKCSNESYLSPTHLTVANSNGEKVVVELELEIYSTDCERDVDNVSFKLYTAEEWQGLADKYINHLTKDELTMILSVAIGNIDCA